MRLPAVFQSSNLPTATAAVLACVLLLLAVPSARGAEWHDADDLRWRTLAPAATRASAGFSRLTTAETGIDFTNTIGADLSLTNAVIHNGAGVALGDLDGDGLPEVYLCALDGPNRLYRNLGNWRFAEMSAGAATCAGQRSTGATFADVDGDLDLDLLVNGIAAGTRLFLNDGRGNLVEARETGLSATASATSLALADTDGDGDLDLYCTHYVDVMYLADPTTRFALARENGIWRVTRVNGESTSMAKWKDRFEALPDGRVRELPEFHGYYRNEGGGRFKLVTFEPGLFQGPDGRPVAPSRDWGLSAMFRDFNGDGAPDLYVCNDNASPDRIWFNTGTGTGGFRAADARVFRHTSRSSMGLDVADVDRDGHDDVLVLDMLARSPARRLRQLMRESPEASAVEDPTQVPRFNRNTLSFGRTDGTYAEAALMAGVAATDWSWGAAFLDVDLDGYEDLLVTNGFEHDVMDQDSHDEMRTKRLSPDQRRRLRQFHPAWHTASVALRNRRDGTFEPAPEDWGFGAVGVSCGMALGDLDGDGDLDVVVNRMNDSAGVFRNEATSARVAVRLAGRAPNTEGIGARLTLRGGPVIQSQEVISGGRYLSGDAVSRVFAVGDRTNAPLELEVRWRSGLRTEHVLRSGTWNVIREPEARGVPGLASNAVPAQAPWFEAVSVAVRPASAGALEGEEAARQPLLPRRLGWPGPAVVWADFNGDGWEDLVATGENGVPPAFLAGDAGRGFRAGAAGAALGGGEVQGARPSTGWLPWVGTGGVKSVLTATRASGGSAADQWSLSTWRLPTDPASGSPEADASVPLGDIVPGALAAGDLDADGDLDVFVGGWYRPGRYPEPVSSSLWRNQGGLLKRDEAWTASVATAQRVTAALLADVDGDGDVDLAVAQDWGGILLFRNDEGRLVEETAASGLASTQGCWRSLAAGDFDGDGRADLVAGNRGRNSSMELHAPGPWRLYFADVQGDGALEVLEAFRDAHGAWRPSRSRTWLERGIPDLGQRFPKHASFSEATVDQILGSAAAGASHAEVTMLESTVFLRRERGFEAVPLPREAQWSPVFGIAVSDFDGDGIQDLFLCQNEMDPATDLSREDAGHGEWLRGRGDGRFDAVPSGIWIGGEQRGVAVADYDHDGRADLAVSQRRGPVLVMRNARARPGLRVQLQGRAGNPHAVGAQVAWIDANGRRGPVHPILAGAGGVSLNALVVAVPDGADRLWVRWPGGRESVALLKPGEREVSLLQP